MIVERAVYKVKQGYMKKLVKLCRKEMPLTGHDPTMRMYTPKLSPGNVIMFEYEFEDLEAMAAHWKEVDALPGTSAFWEKLSPCIRSQLKREVWNLNRLP